MCRFHQLWGFALIAFGLGVLIGLWLEGGFFLWLLRRIYDHPGALCVKKQTGMSINLSPDEYASVGL